MERNIKLDCIKGFAIVFVVYYHIVGVCAEMKESVSVDIFNSFCMQLFFFISGYCSKGVKTFYEYSKVCINKFKRLIIPAVIFFLFSSYILTGSVNKLLSSLFYEYKDGYWFTYVLFFIILIHNGLLCALERVKYRNIIIIFLSLALYSIHNHVEPNKWCVLLSLRSICLYSIYYVLGYTWKQYKNHKLKYLAKNRFVLAVVVIYSLLGGYYVLWVESFSLLLLGLSRIAVVFMLFLSVSMSNDSHFIKFLSYIGRNSIGVYFIHYFFLSSYPIAEYVNWQDGVCGVKESGGKLVIETILVLPLAIAITTFSLLVKGIINKSEFLSAILFGEYRKKMK